MEKKEKKKAHVSNMFNLIMLVGTVEFNIILCCPGPLKNAAPFQ